MMASHATLHPADGALTWSIIGVSSSFKLVSLVHQLAGKIHTSQKFLHTAGHLAIYFINRKFLLLLSIGMLLINENR